MTDFLSEASAIETNLITLRREIHRHPELGRHEELTTRLVGRELNALGIPCRVADAPATCAARGMAKIIEDPKPWGDMMQGSQLRYVWRSWTGANRRDKLEFVGERLPQSRSA